MNHIVKIRQAILAVGIAAILFELLFPPLRSPSQIYSELEHVSGSYHLEAVHVSRFPNWGTDMTKLDNDRGIVRTEIDAGELLRELMLMVVLFGAAYQWLPVIVGQTNDYNERAFSEHAPKKSESKDNV